MDNKEEYIFLNKKYENAVTVIKAQLFDIISNEEKKAMRIGLEMSREGISEEKLRSLQELALRQGEDLGRIITLTTKLSDTLVRLDSYTKILRDLRKEKASTAEVERNVQDTAAEVIVGINETNVSQETKDKVIENVEAIAEAAQVAMPEVAQVQPLEVKLDETPVAEVAPTPEPVVPVVETPAVEEKAEETIKASAPVEVPENTKVDASAFNALLAEQFKENPAPVQEAAPVAEDAGTPLVIDGDAAAFNALLEEQARESAAKVTEGETTAVVEAPVAETPVVQTSVAETPAVEAPVVQAEVAPAVVAAAPAPAVPAVEEAPAPVIQVEATPAAPVAPVVDTPAVATEAPVVETQPLIPVEEPVVAVQETPAPAAPAVEEPVSQPLIPIEEEVAKTADVVPESPQEMVLPESTPLIPIEEPAVAVQEAPAAAPVVEEPVSTPLIPIQEEPTIAPTEAVVADSPSDAAKVVEEAANPEPVEAVVEEKASDKITYTKVDTNKTRALLTSAKQIGNLRSSRSTQEALLNSRQMSNANNNLETQLVENGLLPADTDTMKKQVETMMEQANALYKEGKTVEAQAMYDKISELNKQIQENTSNSLSV